MTKYERSMKEKILVKESLGYEICPKQYAILNIIYNSEKILSKFVAASIIYRLVSRRNLVTLTELFSPYIIMQ